ncbi:MAG: 2-C-methyl-D-erythritol 4-phosphate cytidylyltransferase, partial [Candidatus Heimdallarchaeota archaeon]|nr:2-C-methyl-D-erythritol 4-phosphate cytidylyltransferase [Candidatus Heimdallarchaeota archaeon]
MKSYIVAIITAGGSGKRLKTEIKKQYLCIKERPLLFWTIDSFAKHFLIDEIIVVLPREDIKIYQEQIYSEFTQSNISVVPGGPERQDSVCNAIHACHPKTDIVLIHDGVRP